MKILLFGGNGQVGRELRRSLPTLGEVIVATRDGVGAQCSADFDSPGRLTELVLQLSPDVVVNAAAYTAVDQAESDAEAAFRINAEAPAALARACAARDALLLQYSTDYVFDGCSTQPYREDAVTAPLGVYGASKLAGEQAIRRVGGPHLILRTSWVYSSRGQNFLLTMQRLLQEKPELRIVADQLGAPTWSGTLAQATRTLIERWRAGQPGAWGTYHLCAGGETSWFGFAQAIAQALQNQGKPCARLLPIPASAYPTAAARPLNSRLDCRLIQHAWQLDLPHWRDALAECLACGHLSRPVTEP